MGFDPKEDWQKEFTEFSSINPEQIQVPETSFQQLKKKIFPNPWMVFGKMTAVHAVIGFASLAVCNQFGLNPFQTSQSLTTWFMKIAGHNVCMLLCGFFFMASTYVLANILLSLEEVEAIQRHQWLQTGITGLVSLAAFYFFGAELVGTFVILWFIGVLIGGFLSIESSYRFRRAWA